MTSTLIAAPFDLAGHIRASSQSQHTSTENRSFITELMGGSLSLAAYTQYLAQYAWIYEALEDLIGRVDVSTVPGLDALFDPRLVRMNAIEADLVALGAAHWRDIYPPLAATAEYVEHLRGLDASDGVQALAHHYTRYLGDLSGGQAIASLVARHYGAAPEQLRFFRFEQIESVVRYKRAYRENLNRLDLTDEQVRLLVAEVDASFSFNGALFDALAA
ncbi:biliverdin-producing heme oxygenase [Glaciibacter psychrotolerans]|uniref:Heme oxygenase n=1 Tax=Glaciibacter psychrotolerans TaxID=670054 RepID=A0A7Z0EDG2_9MICO|nr:biliverdin-producing heme oxygenase [Leifsonia psychrotolerans]NYJ19629.1 heme oxygenase [Leifsonia psychrotolerans]